MTKKLLSLDTSINYIVSGIERSGTSMLMQMLHAGGVPIASDSSRPPDPHNPKGYYELEGGKIINRLIDGTFPLEEFKGKFVKITAYGLKFLPLGKYKIIYSERNIEEVLDSMEKMAGMRDENRYKTKEAFIKLNRIMKRKIREREDIDVLFLNYNEILLDPKRHIKSIPEFLDLAEADLDSMIQTIDTKLYRQRRGAGEQNK
ncbi:MAG: sulfotransferase domain-containing protein [Candidatus Sifarchaeia archaeon]